MDTHAMRAWLDERAAADRFSGVVRIDQRGQTILKEGYGLASRTWRVPCRVDMRFDTASITKVFTAVAVLQQIESGAFGLDTSMVDYLDLRDTTISRAVTPYHLLTHTSGIADDADEEDGVEYESLFVDRPNYGVVEIEDHLQDFVHKPANFAPGQGCRYCNASYLLLGLMIERATGQPYREYVSANIFASAGMSRSGFFRMDRVEADVAEGTDPLTDDEGTVIGWRKNIYAYPPIGSPDGGAHVTAGDLMSFHRALIAGRLLGPALTSAILTPKEPYRPMGEGTHMTGFGFEFEVNSSGEVLNYWKEGINVGVSGILSHWPGEDITYVILSNRQDGAWDASDMIEQAIRAS